MNKPLQQTLLLCIKDKRTVQIKNKKIKKSVIKEFAPPPHHLPRKRAFSVNYIMQGIDSVQIRVQFATNFTDGLVNDYSAYRMALTGSVPELGSWKEELSPNTTTKMFTWDVVFDGKGRHTGDVLRFYYQYKAYSEDGKEVWHSRTSTCSFTISKLLNHVTQPQHEYKDYAKVVIVLNSNDQINDCCDLVVIGSSEELGDWDIKNGLFLNKDRQSYRANYFSRNNLSFSYAYMKIQNAQQMCETFTTESKIPSIDFSSSTATVLATPQEKAIVILLDEWDTNISEMDFICNHDTNSWDASLPNSQESLESLKTKTPEEILKRHRQLADRVECKICQDRSVEVVFVPCGHVCVCRRCARNQAMKSCPLCRQRIFKKIRCFL